MRGADELGRADGRGAGAGAERDRAADDGMRRGASRGRAGQCRIGHQPGRRAFGGPDLFTRSPPRYLPLHVRTPDLDRARSGARRAGAAAEGPDQKAGLIDYVIALSSSVLAASQSSSARASALTASARALASAAACCGSRANSPGVASTASIRAISAVNPLMA